MKQLLFTMTIIVLMGALYSCKKEVIKDPPKNACPIFVFEGSENMVWERGIEWEEPGYHCSELEEGGDDLTSSVIVDTSELDVYTNGLYKIFYSATNSLGCSKTVCRNVLVTNPDPPYSISGEYTKNFGTSFMQITENEVVGFYSVSQILDYSQSDVSGIIAFVSEGVYQLANTFFKRDTDMRVIYLEGDVFFDPEYEPNGSITFDLNAYYGDDGSHYANYLVTWYRSE